MNCILCVAKINSSRSHIDIYSDKGKLLGAPAIIGKHFTWLELDESAGRIICRTCWKIVEAFSKFCLQIKRAHDALHQQKIKTEKVLPSAATATKNMPLVTLTSKLFPDDSVARKRRGRPRKRPKEEDFLNKTVAEVEGSNSRTETTAHRIECVKVESASPVIILSEGKNETLKEKRPSLRQTLKNDFEEEEALCEITINTLMEDASCDLLGCDSNDTTTACEEGQQKPSEGRRTKQLSRKTREFDDFIAKNYELTCCLCSVPLANFNVLLAHFRTDHKTRGYILCCGKKFLKRGILVDHILVHQNPRHFSCTQCDRVMADRRCLELHLKGHAEKRERVYGCEVCGKRFFKHFIYTRHLNTHLSDGEKTISCPQCDKTFATAYAQKQHLKIVHLKAYAKICDICGKSVRGSDAFRRHQGTHTGMKAPTVACSICGLSLANKYAMARHKKVRHTAEYQREQVCLICAKVSPNVMAHRRHMQYMHIGGRRHLCRMCDKAFKRAQDLREHMTTHTGEVLYTCPHCPKTFNSNANKHSHRKKAHREEWEATRQQRLRGQAKSGAADTDAPLKENQPDSLALDYSASLLATA